MHGGGRCHGCTTCNGGGARAGGHGWGAVRMQIMAACCMVDILFVSSRKDEQDMTKARLTSHGLGVREQREHVPRKHTPITDPVTLLEYWQSPHPQRFIIPARTVRRLCTLGHRLGLLRRTASGVLITTGSSNLLFNCFCTPCHGYYLFSHPSTCFLSVAGSGNSRTGPRSRVTPLSVLWGTPHTSQDLAY